VNPVSEPFCADCDRIRLTAEGKLRTCLFSLHETDLRDPVRAGLTISAALLDQRALAGIGNIWRNETLFHERVDPWARMTDLDDETLDRLIATARRLLRQSVGEAPGRTPMWVYRRTGRPCRRCGTLIRSAPLANDNPRTTYWCPICQPGPTEAR